LSSSQFDSSFSRRARDFPSGLSNRLARAPLVSNPRTLAGGAPLPFLQEIPAGFDAILQFGSDLLGQYLGRNVALGGQLYAGIDYDKSTLPAPVWDELKGRILAGLSGGSGLAARTSSFPLSASLELVGEYLDSVPTLHLIIVVEESRRARTPRITFDLAQQPARDAQISWRITVEVLVPKTTGVEVADQPTAPTVGLGTADSVGAGQPSSPPSGMVSTTEFDRIPVSWGEAITSADLRIATIPSSYQISARLDFSGSTIEARPLNDYFRHSVGGIVVGGLSGSPAPQQMTLFGALLTHDNQLLSGIRAAFRALLEADLIAITPRMALGGGNALTGLGALHVRAIATRSNLIVGQVLSLCVDLGNQDGDLGLIRPFVGDQNFAYYVSEPIVQRAMLSWWPSVSPKEQTFTNVDVPLTDNAGNETIGQATLRTRFLGLSTVEIVVVSGGPSDALHLVGTYEVQLLALMYEGKDISDTEENKPLKTPEIFGYQIYLFPFETQPSANAPSQVLEDIGRTLLQPLFFPVVGGAPQFGIRLFGQVSQPEHAVFIRGNVPAPLATG
jgi:hypothetical protein